MLKQHALEELAANPALSLTVAMEASEGRARGAQEAAQPNLQLLKRASDSD